MERLRKVEIGNSPLTYKGLLDLVNVIIAGFPPNTPCHTSCSPNCCEIPPTITELEFNAIKGSLTYENQNPETCPLHNQGLCTVYEHRPVECRIYNVLDKTIGVACGCSQEMPDHVVALRELIYRLLYALNGSAIEKPISQWIEESK